MRWQTSFKGRVAAWAVTVGLGLTVGAAPALAEDTTVVAISPGATVAEQVVASDGASPSFSSASANADKGLAVESKAAGTTGSASGADLATATDAAGLAGDTTAADAASVSDGANNNVLVGDVAKGAEEANATNENLSGSSNDSSNEGTTNDATITGELAADAGGTQTSDPNDSGADAAGTNSADPNATDSDAAGTNATDPNATDPDAEQPDATDPAGSTDPTDPTEQEITRITSWRLYNQWTGEHLFTTSKDEYDSLVSAGWTGEGEAWESPESSTTPVYRLYNPYSGDHLFVTSEDEYNGLVAVGWSGEGIAFYSDDAHGTPLYRLYNPFVTVGTHLFTKSAEERLVLASNGWRTEGIGWWGLAAEGPAWAEGWVSKDASTQYFGLADGTFAKDVWLAIDGKLLHFDSDGTLSQGVRLIGDTYYIFQNGETASGWREFGGYGYLFGSDGTPQTGWVQEDGTRRFLDRSTYQMRTGWLSDSGSTYYLGDDGALRTGWQQTGGHYYYFDTTTGAMRTGWFQDGSSWYYLDTSTGAMATGWVSLNGNRYYFDASSGVMQTGWHQEGSNRYYLDPSSGAMHTGWLVLNGYAYYFSTNSGAMFTGEHVIDGYMRNFTVNGVCTNAGYQNPYPYYSINGLPVKPKVSTGIFSYVSPLRIGYNATRSQCVEAFIATAASYIGTPYVWDYACAPGVGVDCAGLVLQCMYSVGMNPTRYSAWDHYNTPGHNHYANDMRNDPKIKKVSKSSLQRGDLLFWSGHVAIYVGGGKVIEAGHGVVTYGTPDYSIASAIAVGRLFV